MKVIRVVILMTGLTAIGLSAQAAALSIPSKPTPTKNRTVIQQQKWLKMLLRKGHSRSYYA